MTKKVSDMTSGTMRDSISTIIEDTEYIVGSG